MQQPQQDKRSYRLLTYEVALIRFRSAAFLLGFLLLGMWFGLRVGYLRWPPPALDRWLLMGGLTAAGYWLFTHLAPLRAYARVGEDHLRIQTPLFRLNVPFRQIVRSSAIQTAALYKGHTFSQGDRWFMQAFQDASGLLLELRALPGDQRWLRTWMGRLLFAPDSAGLVLIVDDWLDLEASLSRAMDRWWQNQTDTPYHGAGVRLSARDREPES